ncbi:T9SS type A sorting domain-containing protein [Paenimyroides baculatum]|uniref:T9SS type A sorting domain-containing protein n=1 Tax=Paenimyroides baculatum TaxID=2608000 RepID=A0A5M6CR05_9FLAO|nr:T9SS type A sorting domain-containing protein [Paenimyroides baculatum]KAA5537614.1 T9SS type A sorting domain-containing protein [Paenimyroides baculatum]
MKKLFSFLLIITCFNSYCQLYKRAWGTLLPISFKTICSPPPNCDTVYFHNNNLVAHLEQKSNTLYHTDFDLNRIYKTSTINPSTSLFYTIPHTGGGSLIKSIKTTSKGDLIICGRTLVNGLATAGAYSTTPIASLFTGSGYVAKIDTSGKLVWFTYFHPILQNSSSLTVDKNDNIYIITDREKTEKLTANTFQSNGDLTHPLIYMNAISKLDTNGKHQWSTFYSKDHSIIRSIIASTNGVYVYGEHLESNASSNYFGSSGSFQEYATGMTTAGTNNANTVFISKFNFNGTRAWSSYFGVDRSLAAQNNILSYNSSLTVINDDAFILTNHEIRPGISKNITTKGVLLEAPVSNSQIDITLTKFLGNGQRGWTTFLYTGNIIEANNIELFVSSTVKKTDPFASNLSTNNAYQKNHGGTDDTFSTIISTDGKKRSYASFYGFVGTDNGVAFPTSKGYFCIGYTFGNTSRFTSLTFSTANSPIKKLSRNTKGELTFKGNYIAYFTTESVTNKEFNQQTFNVYPNPATDILNIQSKENLPENTSFTIYDLSGKIVLNHSAVHSNLNQMNISNLSSGAYILQINNPNINQSFKFIKK